MAEPRGGGGGRHSSGSNGTRLILGGGRGTARRILQRATIGTVRIGQKIITQGILKVDPKLPYLLLGGSTFRMRFDQVLEIANWIYF